MGKIEGELGEISQEISLIKSENSREIATNAHITANQALESINLIKQKLETKFVTSDHFIQEMDSLKKHTDSIIKMPEFADRNTDDSPMSPKNIQQHLT